MKELVISVKVGQNVAYGVETSTNSPYAASARYSYHITKGEDFKPSKRKFRPKRMLPLENLLERKVKREIKHTKRISIVGNLLTRKFNRKYNDTLQDPYAPNTWKYDWQN